jgi:hypothetical protein
MDVTASLDSQLPNGEGAIAQPFRRWDAQPFNVAIRGDCCSRRAMWMNARDLFPSKLKLTENGKAPNICFLDTMQGHTPTLDDLDRVSNIAEMDRVLANYYVEQINRSTLVLEDLDLLVMDSYSDMNFSLWEHRKEHWKIWRDPKYLRDATLFEREFSRIGHRSLDEAVSDVSGYIAAVRRLNPGLPVLFFSQPIDYFPKLAHREDFNDLGRRVAESVEDVFFGGVVRRTELEPDDLNPQNETLHFKAGTYRKMIETAARAGLCNAVDRHQTKRASRERGLAPQTALG